MSILKIMTGSLASLVCKALCVTEGLFSLRRDLPDCCRDNDARRAAIESMREECWRAGL